jgi:hypothetical protein
VGAVLLGPEERNQKGNDWRSTENGRGEIIVVVGKAK